MAASVTAWAKPGAWALDAEEHEAVMAKNEDSSSEAPTEQEQDFPSLTAAAASKIPKKKKKAQTLSLAEFTTGKPVSHGAAGRLSSSSSFSSKGLTSDELLNLPTGPRERSAEELERSSSRGFGYGYGARGRASGEDPNPARWGSSRVSDEPRRGGFGGSGDGSSRDLEPSRADENDDWGAGKKPLVPERRERGGGGGFFDSQSRADESDSWISSKSTAAPPIGRRMGGGGFDVPRARMGGFEMFNKEGSNGGGADSEQWGKKKDLPDSDTWKRDEERSSGGGRRRLVLQARSLPLSNGNDGGQAQDQEKESTEKKSKGSNPFGAARPREEVLAEKGQDWKKIDEKLEAMKIRDIPPERSSFGKNGIGVANGTRRSPESRTDRAWRKPEAAEASPQREDKAENTVPEN
ncbi:eukaryotic translation initiation factor 4B3-like [Musa acuminata AAA Group]|uniref:eukaryotic translation initiation factor 4B3-like n=1 Tax=Musa acuminata AAA Group TaxID=214697 RepID=UPI0031DB3035